MRAPPRPLPITEYFFQSNLFSIENILELSKAVAPSFNFAQAKIMAGDLEVAFIAALGTGSDQINARALEDHYAKIAQDIRRLASTLGLPTDPNKIASRFPLGQQIDETTTIPDGLAWLIDGWARAIVDSKNFTSLITNSLQNPNDPGDWRSLESAVVSAFEQMQGQTLSLAANALRPALEAL